MTDSRYKKILLVLTLAGVLFSGYLSAVKLLTDTCALNEPCPYFLGYPSCWYGFAMYLVMFAATAFALFGKTNAKAALKTDLIVSFLGILFAGRFAIQEFMQSTITGVLGLSTCVYGLIFYILIFITAIVGLKKLRERV